MGAELVVMSTRELDRLGVIRQVLERRITRARAAELLGLGAKQVTRLCQAFERDGAAGLVSRKRGRASNRKIATEVESQAIELVRSHYEDFGPTLVREKLLERHGLKLGKETIRRMLRRAGIWVPRDQRLTSRGSDGPVSGSWFRSMAASTPGSRTAGPVARCWCTSTMRPAG